MSPESDFGCSGLDGVRRRGVFLFSVLTWAAAAGFLLIASAYLIFLVNQAISVIEGTRSASGLHAPSAGPDWLLISALLVMAAVPVAALAGLGKVYREYWNRRLDLVWAQSVHKTEFGKVLPIETRASAEERPRRMRFLRTLLSTPCWKSRWDEIRNGGAIPPHCESVTGHDEAVSAEVLKSIEKSITERAIATAPMRQIQLGLKDSF